VAVNAAVIDVGSHTVRLLVAEMKDGRLRTVRESKAALGLGLQVEEHGHIPDAKLEETAARARAFARTARKDGALRIETIVTAPGRQSANGQVLVSALVEATGTQVRILTPDEEGRLAYRGAVSSASVDAETIAVVDVGGGSTEVAVGTRTGGPVWIRSFDIGALRLTRRSLLSDPPAGDALAAAADEVGRELAPLTLPLPQAALATGGTARALRKMVGPSLGVGELAEAVRILAAEKTSRVAKKYGVERGRARTLAAGAVILAAVQHRLGVPMTVSRHGLREGAILAVFDELASAAA
jgi:exopolyphosphatase/guanosine-5'-triphosphate,3'-diphosphate pyrophosphatase